MISSCLYCRNAGYKLFQVFLLKLKHRFKYFKKETSSTYIVLV